VGDYTPFEPGAYWTPERKAAAYSECVAIRDSDAMQGLMRQIGEAAAEGDPAAAAAAASGVVVSSDSPMRVLRDACIYRRGRASDALEMAALIVSGELPPFFLEPFIDGFLVIEHDGRMVATGGLEFYGEDAVIRSVVVDPAARGIGLGVDVGRLLEEDALKSGARDVYLFTMHAHEFWKRLGYIDLPLDKWPENVRENWQYQFVAGYPQASRDVYAMVKHR
jgi:N-acetylglutamate synthase-like GNAT family acetyltransferase